MTNRILPIALAQEWLGQYTYVLLRWAIILGVLAGSAWLGRRASDSYLIMIAGACALLVLLRFPLLGLVALLVGSLVVPFSIGTATQTPLNIAVLLVPVLLGVWIADMIRRRKLQLVPSRTTLPLLAFVGAATLSFLAADLPWNLFAKTASFATQAGGWAIFVFSAAIFLLTANLIADERWLKVLVALCLSISGLYMLGRLNLGLGFLSTTMNRIGADGSLFWDWTIALAFGQLLFNRKLSRKFQLGLVLLIAGMMGIAWFQARSWTSGWLPPMVALGTILWLRSWRLGLLVTVAGGVLVLVLNPDLLNSLVGTESYSLYTRDAARDILLTQILPLSPILGLGPANYYWYTPLYPILGWYVSFNSHNNYVDILLQVGLLGMISFLWFVFEVARLGWHLRTRFTNDFAQGYVYGCLGGLAGTLVASYLADWLLPFVYNIGLNGFRASLLAWLFLGGLVSLEQIKNGNIQHRYATPNSGQGGIHHNG